MTCSHSNLKKFELEAALGFTLIADLVWAVEPIELGEPSIKMGHEHPRFLIGRDQEVKLVAQVEGERAGKRGEQDLVCRVEERFQEALYAMREVAGTYFTRALREVARGCAVCARSQGLILPSAHRSES